MRIIGLITVAGLSLAAAAGQVPREDIRNTYTPSTNTHFQMPEYKTLAQWEARKQHLRNQILSAAGLMPMPQKTPLNAQIFGRLDRDGYSIEKVYLETLPGYYLGGNLYRPRGRSGKLPAIASPHGHWTYGRLENQQLGSIPLRGISFARQGYVAFTYDMVGYTDTTQTPHVFGGPREELWSFGPLGLQLWNSIRVIDFLQSLPDVDPDRIAATGASGGGTQTFLLTAVDDRVKVSAPVNMISAIMQGGSPCENAPNLRVGAFNVEIGAMMAPRPMLMVSATGDWTHNTPREEFPAIQHIYELYDRAALVETTQIDAPHNYNQQSREAVYRFFGKHVLHDDDVSKYSEKEAEVEKLQDMLVFHGRALPSNAVSYEELVGRWIAAAKKQNDETTDTAALRERLRYSLGAETPEKVLNETSGENIVLSRAGRGDRVPGVWIPGKGAAALVVAPEGAKAARASSAVRDLLAAKRPVLLIDAFQTGSAVAPRKEGDFFLTFNRSNDANRVQDILTGLAFLRSSGAGDVELIGLGKAAVWSLFAAAVSDAPVRLTADLGGFNGSDQDFIDRFFVPGIQRAGGLRAAQMLVRAH
jgi:dienelactone hydrolase